METIFANLIRNLTGKELMYKDSFFTYPTLKEAWFMDATFDGETYKVVSLGEEGVVKLFKKHPIDQNKIPTSTIKFSPVN